MSNATTTDSADFYALESLLDDDEQDFLHRVRDFMKSEVEPSINQHWQRGSFPFEIVPGFRQLGLAGLPYQGFGCPGRSFLLDGMVAMELARTDPSIATFAGVHGGLSMGSIYLCGSEEQKQQYLPDMARFDKIGAFGLTEPDVGSGASGGLTTTARKRRRFVDSQRAEEMDRQRHLRRPHRHLGQRRRRRPGQGVHRRQRHPGVLDHQTGRQDCPAHRAERRHHPRRCQRSPRTTGCRTRTRSATPLRCCG